LTRDKYEESGSNQRSDHDRAIILPVSSSAGPLSKKGNRISEISCSDKCFALVSIPLDGQDME